MKKRILCALLALLLAVSSLALFSCTTEINDGEDESNSDSESGFDETEWTGEESDMPGNTTTEIPENYVTPVREEGETNDSPAIARALETIKESGGTLYFPESRYTVSEPIVIYKNITYVGRGVGQTTITVEKGANCDAFITNKFDTYCDQQNYGKLVSAYFGPNSDLPQNFEIRGLTIDGNANFAETNTADKTYTAKGNTSGSGIKIFGKRYIVKDVQIQNFAQIGFYSEFNADEVTGVDNSFDYFICSKVDGLRVIATGEEGMIYRGPTDQELDGLWICASCLTGKSTVYADRANWELASVVFEDKESSNGNTPYCASPELGFAHIWRGFNCWGMVLVGQLRFKADHLIIESTNGGLKTSNHAYSQISILDIHNCMYGDNSRPYLYLRSGTHTKISNLELRYGYDTTNKDMMWITGSNVTIGECQLRGNRDVVGTSKAGGHGVVISGNFNQIAALNAMQFCGKGSDGKTAAAIVIKENASRNIITGVITNSTVGAAVYDKNNTLTLSTRTDRAKGDIPIQANEGVLAGLMLTLVDWDATTKAWTQYPANASAAVNATTTEEQTVKIAHASPIKPAVGDIVLSLANPDGISGFSVDYVTVISVDDTYITVKVKLSDAASSGTLRVNAKIG